MKELRSCFNEGQTGSLMSDLDDQQERIISGCWRSLWIWTYGNNRGKYFNRLPTLGRLAQKYHRILKLMYVSVMEPGTFLRPHLGLTKSVLRFQYPLQIPNGFTGGLIGTPKQDEFTENISRYTYTPIRWQEKKAMMFDDVTSHTFWNMTQHRRIVLFVDIERPLDPRTTRLLYNRVEKTKEFQRMVTFAQS